MTHSKGTLISSLVISFSLGVGSTLAAHRLYSTALKPAGFYTHALSNSGFDFRLLHMHSRDKTHVYWVYENRPTLFQSESGLMAKTLYSKVTIDCSNFQTTILEQRAFDHDGLFLARNKAIVQNTSGSIAANLAMIEACIARL